MLWQDGYLGVEHWMNSLRSTIFVSEFLFIMINEDSVHWVGGVVHNPAGIELLYRGSGGSKATGTKTLVAFHEFPEGWF